MVIAGLIAYVFSYGVGYLAGYLLPQGPWTPYVPLLVAYHVFLASLLAAFAISGEQKVGLSMSFFMTAISHIAFVGALVGVVHMREYVPLFGLVRYLLPGLAPFEAKWLFEGQRKVQTETGWKPMPSGSAEDYIDFTEYMKQKNRRFARAGRSVHDEFVAWNADRVKRRADEATEQETTETGPS